MSVLGGTIVVRVEGQDIGLTTLLARINQQMAGSQGTIRNYTTAMAQVDPKTRAADQALARYAQSLATVAARSRDFSGAQKILGEALQQITPNTTAANGVLAQLQSIINQASNEAAQGGLNIRTFAAGIFALQGVAAIATRVLSAFGETINLGNQLEKTLTSFEVLSGSQAKYRTNLEAARKQQDLFGGSLQDTVEGMSVFANLSNRTGIEIQKLTNLSRALATVDPAQGFKGMYVPHRLDKRF